MKVYVLIFACDIVEGVFSSEENARNAIPDWDKEEEHYAIFEYELDKVDE